MVKTLLEIHEDVPPDHYDRGLKVNFFQKIWHKSRFREVTDLISPVSGPVLDIGCHSGTFTQQILKRIGSRKIYGVDVSPAAIKLISRRFKFGNFKVADAGQLPFRDNFFDAVFCLEVLEHVENPEKVLKEVKRVLKKGGYGILLVPSDNKLFKFVWFLWTLYYPVWRHAHVQSFTKDQLEKIVKMNGLRVVMVKQFNLGMLKLIKLEK